MRKEKCVGVSIFEVFISMHQDNNSLRDSLYFKCVLWAEDRNNDLVSLDCAVQQIKEGVHNCLLGTWPMSMSQIQPLFTTQEGTNTVKKKKMTHNKKGNNGIEMAALQMWNLHESNYEEYQPYFNSWQISWWAYKHIHAVNVPTQKPK